MSKKNKKQTGEQPKVRPQQVVYVGPSLGGEIMISQNTVYRGDIPARVQEVIKKHPLIGQTFVPVEKLAASRQKLRDPKSGISGRFRALKGLKK